MVLKSLDLPNVKTIGDFSLRDNEYKTGNINNWEIKHFDFFEENTIPILRNTWVPSYVDAQTAYYNIEEWLIAQHNDVDQESKGLTDIDKVIVFATLIMVLIKKRVSEI